MNKRVRNFVKRWLPDAALIPVWNAYCRFRARSAKAALQEAGTEPAYLGWNELDHLQKSYPPVEWDYHYDEDTLRQRGRERVTKMLKLVGRDEEKLHRFLDLGAWDGMSCAVLQDKGKETVGIDIRTEGFSQDAMRSGVAFLQMDASRLGLVDNSFDFAFSFNSFEHFSDPEAVYCEAMRVLRPGGYLYVNFGPLYWSAKGAHQFRTINVPFNQCLFSKSLLREYASANDLELMGFYWMNEWSIGQYRALWKKYAQRLRPVHYLELFNADHVDLIVRYPTCFKSKSSYMDDFIVAYIEGLFQKVN